MQKEDISLLISVHWKADHRSAKTITSRTVIGKFYLKKTLFMISFETDT